MQVELIHSEITRFLAKLEEWGCKTPAVGEFKSYKEQVLAGALEAKTNYDLLKEIELPFVTLTSPTGLTNAPLLFPGMMSTLQALYAKSTFYKESRLISLLEKIVGEILKVVEQQIEFRELFTALYESKGRAKKVNIRLAQAYMIIDIISKHLFIKDWLNAKKPSAPGPGTAAGTELSYLKFSRPDTAYIHELPRPSSQSKYVELTNKSQPPHLRIQQRLSAASERCMWFERAQMVLSTVEYVKKAATNIEAMAATFGKICDLLSMTDPKLGKLHADAVEFIEMYRKHEMPYEVFELASAEAFESFIVLIF